MKFASSLNFSERSREGVLELNESLELIKSAGMSAIEIDLSRGLGAALFADESWENKFAELRKALDDAGFKTVSVHALHDPMLYIPDGNATEEDIKKARIDAARAAKVAHILGAEFVVIHPVDNHIDAEYDREVNVKTNLEHYAMLKECVEQNCYGVKIAVENVYYSSAYRLRRRFGESAEEVILLAEALGGGVCWNCGHAHPVTMDQARAVEKIGDRLVLMHISDSRGHTDAGLPPMIGGGNIKWESIMPAVAKIGFEGYAVLVADQYLSNMPKALQKDAAEFAGTVCRRLVELCDSAK
ncbi:MAG: sugar phosphate isomerase/epimerase [Clostridia bacterium]|nr:sugar phosphate isomerase/epimerase [Clostridia bacterium]